MSSLLLPDSRVPSTTPLSEPPPLPSDVSIDSEDVATPFPRFPEQSAPSKFEPDDASGFGGLFQRSLARLTLPRLLRLTGSALLCLAAVVFILQRWDGIGDVARYFHFLAFTVGMSGIGLFCATRLREEKSARTFLGLACAVVPAHFTVLGAILYSQFNFWSGHPSHYPAHALIQAADKTTALGVTAIGIALLTPLIAMAMRVFARPRFVPLTLAFLMMNVLLLIPTRHSEAIGMLAVAGAMILVATHRRIIRNELALRTFEGGLVRAMLVTPLFVLIVRSLYLHDVSSLLISLLLATFSAIFFSLLPASVASTGHRQLLRLISIPFTLGAAATLADAVRNAADLPVESFLPMAALPAAAIFGWMSVRIQDSQTSTFRGFGTLLAAGAMSWQLVTFPGPISSFLLFVTAVAVLVIGWGAQQMKTFLLGIATLLFGILFHARYAQLLFEANPWLCIGGVGVASVFAAALLERNGSEITAWARKVRVRFAA